MKKILFYLLLVVSFNGLCWGFYGHQLINRTAVYTLPPSMMAFYKQHIEYVSTHSVDPDKRRNRDTAEACRHFIDLDYYEKSFPIDTVPIYWKDAVEKFSTDTLLKYGIVPWHVQRMLYRLTEAFGSKDIHRILQTSAEIGHYMADACVPLHASMNYNGQLTGQNGIHGFWESRLPELFSDQYEFYTGPAEYIQYPQRTIWEASAGSFQALDSVLTFERLLNNKFPSDLKYEFVQKSGMPVKTYSYAYSNAYHELLHGMVERRMKLAIYLTASLWYTAWIDAGEPDLNKLNEASQVLNFPDYKVSQADSARVLKGIRFEE